MEKNIKEEEEFLMADSKSSPSNKQQRKAGWIPARYLFAVLGCLGIVNVYAMRVNLSVAIVAMVKTVKDNGTNSNHTMECADSRNKNETDLQQDGEFEWDQATQSLILGSFFWGYILTQLPGGRMAEIYSAKWIFGLGVFCTAIFTLLTPIAARAGYGYLVAIRVLEGLGEGVTFPTMHAMIARWSPPNERSRIVTIIFAGSLIGTVIGLPISGILTEHGFAGGWPSVFYVFGGFGILWFILWTMFAYDNPETHPFISKEEKDYIRQSIGCKKYMVSPPVPWKKVLKSLPLWAIVVGHFSHNWGFYTLLTELPTYLKSILHFKTEKNGFMSALPYFTAWIFSFVASFVSDKMIQSKFTTTTRVRKIFQVLGQILPAICMIGVTLTGCNQDWPFILLVLAVTSSAATFAGFQCNHIDIAPNYAGTLLGITNTIATIPGWMGPYTVGALTNNKPYRSQWAIVFYIAAGIYVFAASFYAVFGSGEEQSWNRIHEDSKVEVEANDSDLDVPVEPKLKGKRI